MNTQRPAKGKIHISPSSGFIIRYCPYCRADGRSGEHLEIWYSRSATSGLATRWTRCEMCFAMWREVYNWESHVYEYREHWIPKE